MFRKILVGLDGSDAAEHALKTAFQLARLAGSAVHVVSVEERLPAYAATVGEVDGESEFRSEYFREPHDWVRRAAANAGVPVETSIVPGHASQTLVHQAEAGGSDLIVIGHTGHSRLHKVFLGSTADRVVAHAHCPVLVVR
jgi:nucleotide-binding universal stress UspA family protein